MKTLGNILWHFPFLGFLNAFFVFIIGLILSITVVAAPIGIGLIEFSKFLLAPFSRVMIKKSDLKIEQNKSWENYSKVVMILWIPIGIFLSALALLQIAGLFLSIIGIPNAIVVAKSLGTYFNPVNKKCVPGIMAEEIERRKGQEILDKQLDSVSGE